MKVLVVLLALLLIARPDDFDTFKAKMEAKVLTIANEMERIFGSRCNDTIATCEVLSYNDCVGTN